MAKTLYSKMKIENENLVIVSSFSTGAPWSKNPEKLRWTWIATYENAEKAIEAYKDREGHFRIRNKRTNKVIWEK